MSDTPETRVARSWKYAAAGVVAILIVLGLIIAIINITSDDDDAPSAAPTSDPTEEATTDESVCGLEGHDTEGSLNQPPENVEWELIDTIAIPSSDTAGPGTIEDNGLRYCYAHTPEGALLAAANTFAWGSLVGTKTAPELVKRSVAEGPGYEAALKQISAASGVDSTPGLQIAGFRLLSYDNSTALLDIAVEQSGALAHMKLELVWQGGDWKLRPQPDGSSGQAAPLPDLTGFIPWQGA